MNTGRGNSRSAVQFEELCFNPHYSCVLISCRMNGLIPVMSKYETNFARWEHPLNRNRARGKMYRNFTSPRMPNRFPFPHSVSIHEFIESKDNKKSTAEYTFSFHRICPWIVGVQSVFWRLKKNSKKLCANNKILYAQLNSRNLWVLYIFFLLGINTVFIWHNYFFSLRCFCKISIRITPSINKTFQSM